MLLLYPPPSQDFVHKARLRGSKETCILWVGRTPGARGKALSPAPHAPSQDTQL